MLKFGESGHPVFRSTSPLSRGVLKSKGGGKLSIHIWRERLKLFFRTLISVNQLSIYGADSDLCEEYKSCHVRTRRLVLAGQSHPLFVPASLLVTTPTPLTEVPAQGDLLPKYQERVERLSQQNRVFFNFVLMQDSWQRLTSDSISWQKTLESSHNLQIQWHVVSILYQEMKKSTDRKGWIRGNTQIGPVLEVTTSYLEGKFGVEIRIESKKQGHFSLVGQNFSWIE